VPVCPVINEMKPLLRIRALVLTQLAAKAVPPAPVTCKAGMLALPTWKALPNRREMGELTARLVVLATATTLACCPFANCICCPTCVAENAVPTPVTAYPMPAVPALASTATMEYALPAATVTAALTVRDVVLATAEMTPVTPELKTIWLPIMLAVKAVDTPVTVVEATPPVPAVPAADSGCTMKNDVPAGTVGALEMVREVALPKPVTKLTAPLPKKIAEPAAAMALVNAVPLPVTVLPLTLTVPAAVSIGDTA
jgi:hypothetical protein